LLAVINQVHLAKSPQRSYLQAARSALWINPGADHGFQPIYRSKLERHISSYGVAYYTPAQQTCTDNWQECIVWDCPLPGFLSINNDLAYQGAGITSGFMLKEPSASWTDRFVGVVKLTQEKEHLNARQLAFRFGVSSRTIQEALRH